MRRILLTAAMAGLVTTSASAFPIAYRESGIGSGSFSGRAFNDRLITITFSGDTDNIDSFNPVYNNVPGSAVVTIADVGTGTIANAFVYANNAGSPAAVGIGDYTSGTTIMGTLDALFSTYALDVINPITSVSFFRSDVSFATSRGDLQIGYLGLSTFSASQVGTVPLPASLPLFSAALLGLGVVTGRLCSTMRASAKV